MYLSGKPRPPILSIPLLLSRRQSSLSGLVPSSIPYFFGCESLSLLPTMVVSVHTSPVTCLDVDSNCEGRYLLSGGSDCRIAVYDLQGKAGTEEYQRKLRRRKRKRAAALQAAGGGGGGGAGNVEDDDDADDPNVSDDDSASRSMYISPLQRAELAAQKEQRLRRRVPLSQAARCVEQQAAAGSSTIIPSGHRFSISTVKWFPADTGLFVSTDLAGGLLAWDTNAFTPVVSIPPPITIGRGSSPPSIVDSCFPPLTASSSPLSSTIGVATSHGTVSLLSIVSGTQILHLPAASAGCCGGLEFHPHNPFLLSTCGATDGTIKLWDVRRSGSSALLFSLDCEGGGSGVGVGMAENLTESSNRSSSSSSVTGIAPSNFKRAASTTKVAHRGGVGAHKWTTCGNHIVSYGPAANELFCWNVRCDEGGDVGSNLLPFRYELGGGGRGIGGGVPTRKRMWAKTPLVVVEPGRRSKAATTAFLSPAHCRSKVVGVRLFGDGKVMKELVGHLGDVECIVKQGGNTSNFWTGGEEGLVLGWGYVGKSTEGRRAGEATTIPEQWG